MPAQDVSHVAEDVDRPVSHAAQKRPARNDRIDALKFFAIAMVVLTHVLNLRPEFKYVAPWLVDAMLAFNMPLFAMLAGYVYFGREGRGFRFLGRKALSLLVPYVAWILLVMPLRHLPVQDWLPRAGQALVDPHAGFQMWFLWTLFWVFAVFIAAQSTPWPDATVLLLAVASAAIWLGHPSTWHGFDKLTWLYLFFTVGYFAARHRDRIRPVEPAIFAAGAVAIIFIVSLGLVRQYPLAAGFAGVAGACGLYLVLPKATIGVQAWMGRRSMGIYGSQMIVLPFCIVGAQWWGAALSWFLAFAGSLLLTLLLEQTVPTKAVFLGVWPKQGTDALASKVTG